MRMPVGFRSRSTSTLKEAFVDAPKPVVPTSTSIKAIGIGPFFMAALRSQKGAASADRATTGAILIQDSGTG